MPKPFTTKILWAVLFLSVALNIFLVFQHIDMAISLDYCRSQQNLLDERADRSLDMIRRLLTGIPRAKVEETGRALADGGEIVKSIGDTLEIGDVVIVFGSDTVCSVGYLGEISEEAGRD